MDVHKWVIEPNILISYCLSKKLHQLPALIEKYNIEFCADDNLLNEFTSVITRDRFKAFLSEPPQFYVDVVRFFLRFYDTTKMFSGSPDINDDYLFDLALQTGAAAIVTGDKSLLKWHNPPLQIISWRDFQLTYPL